MVSEHFRLEILLEIKNLQTLSFSLEFVVYLLIYHRA